MNSTYEVKLIRGPLDGETHYLTELFAKIRLPTRLNRYHVYRFSSKMYDDETGTFHYDYVYAYTYAGNEAKT